MKFLLSLVFALLACPLFAQAPPPQISVHLGEAKLKPGQLAKATVKVKFAPGLHGYQNPPSEDYMIPVTVTGLEGVQVVSVHYPPGHGAKIGGSATEVMTYSDEIEIQVYFRAPKKVGAGKVSLNVMYQQCNDDSCFPPGNAQVNASYSVNGTGMASSAARLGNDVLSRVRGRS